MSKKRSMLKTALRALISGLLVTLSLGLGAQNLMLTLSSAPPTPGVISTRSARDQTLLVSSGNTVSLARASGRDYRLEASGGFFWTQVQEVPEDSESLEITPTLQDDGSIEVGLTVAQKNGTRVQRFSTSVVARPGEWTQLLGPDATAQRGVRTYGTTRVNADTLFLRVDP